MWADTSNKMLLFTTLELFSHFSLVNTTLVFQNASMMLELLHLNKL